MRNRKRYGVLLALAMILFAGCSNQEGEKQKQESAGKQKDEVSAEAEVDYSTPLPEDYEGVLTMWGWDDIYYKTITEAFQKKYPNVKFVYTPVENGDLMQKYENSLITGGQLPDIGWAIMAYRAKIFELDMWEPLNQEPYQFELTDVLECTREQLLNTKGDVCGIEQNLSAAGLAYRKDLAKEYLGTDDPKELEAMFPDWQAFIEKGKEVYQKSGGQVYMLPGLGDAQQFIREQAGVSWIEGNQINATETLQHSLDIVCSFRDNNTADTLQAWTPEWYDAMGDGRHIFTECATWSVAFQIEQYDPEGKESGHWGLMSAPEGNILWGGTTLGITKTCKDKRLAWEFIKFATLSADGAKGLNSIGTFTTAKEPYLTNPELCSFKSRWFGDQDIGAYFINEIVPNITSRKQNIDDSVIHESLNLVTTSLRKSPEITAEDAMEFLKEDLKEKLPNYEIK